MDTRWYWGPRFLYSAGTITSYDVTGAFAIFPQSINAAAQITGYYNDGRGIHGFLDSARHNHDV
jgi:hypothetical protein